MAKVFQRGEVAWLNNFEGSFRALTLTSLFYLTLKLSYWSQFNHCSSSKQYKAKAQDANQSNMQIKPTLIEKRLIVLDQAGDNDYFKMPYGAYRSEEWGGGI